MEYECDAIWRWYLLEYCVFVSVEQNLLEYGVFVFVAIWSSVVNMMVVSMRVCGCKKYG